MKNKQLRLRMTERRYNKLQLYALQADKTMTAIVEDLIDSLPSPNIDKNSTALQSVLPTAKNN
jgi:hypothetical protein